MRAEVLVYTEQVLPSNTVQLFRLLRPELVLKSPTPLSSDAYHRCATLHDEGRQQKQQVDEATNRLYHETIPSLAQQLPVLLLNWWKRGGSVHSFRLSDVIHREGVNIRHYGRILHYLNLMNGEPIVVVCRRLLLAEICARVIKARLRGQMRNVCRNSRALVEEPFRKVVVDELNLVFGGDQQSDRHWNGPIKKHILSSFQGALELCGADSPQFDLKNLLGARTTHVLHHIFERVKEMTALHFSPLFQESCQHPDFFLREYSHGPIDEIDLLSVGEKIKSMNIVSLAKGVFYLAKAREQRPQNAASAARFFRMAAEEFEEAISSNPTSKIALRNCGNAYLGLELLQSPSAPSPTSQNMLKAEEYFRRAIELDLNDPVSISTYGQYLMRIEQKDRAKIFFLKALTLNPNDLSTLYKYAHLAQRETKAAILSKIRAYK